MERSPEIPQRTLLTDLPWKGALKSPRELSSLLAPPNSELHELF
jgi:hypothetical protein